jgi:YidC/Oxa1 family membrane protein insertase
MPDSRNLIIAVVLSLVVLIGWQYFFASPQIERMKKQQEQAEQLKQQPAGPGALTGAAPSTQPSGTMPASPGSDVGMTGTLTREAALAQSPRVQIETTRLSGSINLKGGRLDDLRLNDFHETVDKSSPTIVLLSPAGTSIQPGNPHNGIEDQGPYFAEFGWLGESGGPAVPGPDTLWTAPEGARLTTTSPVTLTYDNGSGLVFKRTIALDAHYMFTVTDAVENKTGAAVKLTPYGRVTRVGEIHTAGYFILHEGLIGVFGDEGLEEYTYKNLTKTPEFAAKPADKGWLGVTGKYWATALIPEKGRTFEGRFTRSQQVVPDGQEAPPPRYQADFRGDAVSVAPGSSGETRNMLFAGAKEVALVDGYEKSLGIERFELLIDWGWFYFITKPMFFFIDWFYRLLGNFGLAILAVTVVVKLVFFPLANKSYKSMSGMKKVQPQMAELRERFKDDKMKQQQALMELYKKEKINPISGCWPMVLQIPVFFSLYKVLFVTIEMRHAPFFGWIRDLSAPDPSHIFNLFGLLPFDPSLIPVIGGFLAIGVWPIIMGITMFVQMRLNPTPADPAQQVIFTWMPVIFTFMLASFPAGLVIYWAWNNTLSVIQQYVIMRRQGVDVDLWGNVADTFRRKKKNVAPATPALPKAANDSGKADTSDKQTRKKAKPSAKGKPREADAQG